MVGRLRFVVGGCYDGDAGSGSGSGSCGIWKLARMYLAFGAVLLVFGSRFLGHRHRHRGRVQLF